MAREAKEASRIQRSVATMARDWKTGRCSQREVATEIFRDAPGSGETWSRMGIRGATDKGRWEGAGKQDHEVKTRQGNITHKWKTEMEKRIQLIYLESVGIYKKT
jgi:hypothetical protein